MRVTITPRENHPTAEACRSSAKVMSLPPPRRQFFMPGLSPVSCLFSPVDERAAAPRHGRLHLQVSSPRDPPETTSSSTSSCLTLPTPVTAFRVRCAPITDEAQLLVVPCGCPVDQIVFTATFPRELNKSLSDACLRCLE